MSSAAIFVALTLQTVPVTQPASVPEPAAQVGVATQTTPTPAPLPPDPVMANDIEAADYIVVSARRRHMRGDPLESLNAQSFAVTQKIDDAVLGPIAMTYAHEVPSPIRDGLRNLRYNLQEPIVAVNFVLQGKPGKAIETVGRFAINSTIGVVGLFDMARRKAFRLPRRRNGFANTMGVHGIRPGPYFFLPLIGPTTARDLVGNILDFAVMPLSFIKPLRSPAFVVPTRAVTILDRRAEFDEELSTIRQTDDPYAARRDLYLKQRQAEIDHLRGRDGGTPTTPASSRVPLSGTP